MTVFPGMEDLLSLLRILLYYKEKTFDVIIDALMKGEKVELRNFGVFKIKERRARFGRNPRTGQSVPVHPRKVVVFKSGLEMKHKVK